MPDRIFRLLLGCVFVGFLAVVPLKAEAVTVSIYNASIDLDVSEMNGKQIWTLKVTRKDTKKILKKLDGLGTLPKIESLHLKGLPGDLKDKDDYDDFSPSTDPWSQSVVGSELIWKEAAGKTKLNPFGADGGMVTFSFKSKFKLKDALATGKFRLAVDYRTKGAGTAGGSGNNVISSKVLDDLKDFPFSIPKIALPASAPLLLCGLLSIFALFGRQRQRPVITL